MLSLNKKNKVQKYSNVVFYEETFILRLKDDEKKKILKVAKHNQDIFENPSHYVRCAIIRDLRNYDKNGVRIKR